MSGGATKCPPAAGGGANSPVAEDFRPTPERLKYDCVTTDLVVRQRGGSLQYQRCIARQPGSGEAFCLVQTLETTIYGHTAIFACLEEEKGGAVCGVWTRTGSHVCFKSTKNEWRQKQSQEQLKEDPLREIAVLRRIKDLGGHPNLNELLFCMRGESYLHVVLECCDQSLFAVVKQAKQGLPEARACEILSQCLDAIGFLHASGLAHLDVSLANTMLLTCRNTTSDSYGRTRVVIIDFGQARELPQSGRLSGRFGKASYYLPEMIRGEPFDPIKADVWALGIMLFIIATGNPPWVTPYGHNEVYKMICLGQRGGIRVLLRHWNANLSDELIDLLQRLMWDKSGVCPPSLAASVTGRGRIRSIANIRRHPWMRGACAPPPPPPGRRVSGAQVPEPAPSRLDALTPAGGPRATPPLPSTPAVITVSLPRMPVPPVAPSPRRRISDSDRAFCDAFAKGELWSSEYEFLINGGLKVGKGKGKAAFYKLEGEEEENWNSNIWRLKHQWDAKQTKSTHDTSTCFYKPVG